MKTSGTKPMKNTMRKSPMKQGFMGTASAATNAVKKVRDFSSAVAAKKAQGSTKSTPTTKPGKPAGKPNASVKTPAMQLKKHKC